MEYGLTRRILGCKHFVPLSKAQFEELRRARDLLVAALATEEKLEMLLQSYIEYEHEVLHATLTHTLFRVKDWSGFRDLALRINRRLVHLLSVGRLYLEHLRHDARLLFETGSKPAPIKRITSAEYDSRLGYRVMEALRNYVQHRGLPLHSITFGGRWVDTEHGRRRKQDTALYLDIELLAGDPKFKKAVLDELASGETRIAIKPLVRDYVTGLIRVQQKLREETADRIKCAEELLEDSIARYRAEVEDSITGLAAVARGADGTHKEHVSIFRDVVERRRFLERKNGGAGELSKVIVGSE